MGRKAKRKSSPARRPSVKLASTPWPFLESFVAVDGEVTIGRMPYGPRECSAMVLDEGGMIVGLVRRRGETLHALLDRVEAALPDALENGIFIDELTIATEPKSRRRRRRRRRRR